MVRTNKLNGMMCYLIGPIDRCPDAGMQWREEMSTFLKTFGVDVVNPHDKPFEIGVEDEAARAHIKELKKEGIRGFQTVKDLYSVIRTVDLRCVDKCDFMVSYIDVDIHSCGSYEETTLANRQKKPVLTTCKQGLEYVPNWEIFKLPAQHFFRTFEHMMYYIEAIDNGYDDGTGRWVFRRNA